MKIGAEAVELGGRRGTAAAECTLCAAAARASADLAPRLLLLFHFCFLHLLCYATPEPTAMASGSVNGYYSILGTLCLIPA